MSTVMQLLAMQNLAMIVGQSLSDSLPVEGWSNVADAL